LLWVMVERAQKITRRHGNCILHRPIDSCLGRSTPPILAASPVPSVPTNPQMGSRLASRPLPILEGATRGFGRDQQNKAARS
jgi:hypothetical protein